ncbi:FecR family protein [Spongiivirga sp. MCCC 1A20706]|uniref:FecR family protein n=1 Tax=Spongiivirga sp. MCCC 1A20706 TaxID=3160963 RepID=UPI003977484A
MKREDLIKKWLRNELDNEELIAFKQLEDYDEIVKISDTAKSFRAPLYVVTDELEAVTKRMANRPKKKSPLRLISYAAAAIVIFTIGFYVATISKWDTKITTELAEKTNISLPDESEVILNAASSLSYDTKKWDKERLLILHGEAYFKVAKGKKFDVETDNGVISVLGTQFNVKSRQEVLEVTCFEGLVSVNSNNEILKLAAGNTVRFVNGEKMSDITTKQIPDWPNNISSFKSVPLQEAFDEFTRQYKLTVDLKGVDASQIFTGQFTHTNKEMALKAITLPFGLEYQIKNNKVVISASETK